MTLRSFLPACLLFACVLGATPRDPADDGPSRWIGGYAIGNGSVSGALVLRSPASGVFLPQAPAGDSVPVRLERLGGGRVRVSLGSRVLEGARGKQRWSGRARDGASRGTFVFARIVPIASENLERFVGDYVAAPGETLVIGRSLGQLFALAPDGTQSPLWATRDSSFVGGASIGTSYPLASEAAFGFRGGEATLTWRHEGRPARAAHRVACYDAQEVSFTNGATHLAGTVLMPRTPGPHPGVVLVHGSNAQSRNGQRSIYRFHADFLARRGIAVLLYDKRGIGGSSGHWDDPDIADDVLAALRALREHAGVDAQRVGLWGLSQGSWLVVRAAATAPDEVAFVVPVGGGGLSPQEQEIARTALQLRADGFAETEVRRAVELQRLKFHYAATGEGWDDYLAAIESARGQRWLDDPYIGPPTDRASPAWEFWKSGLGGGGIDATANLARVRCPVFAIAGALDTYSPPRETLAKFDSLRAGGNREVRTWRVPNGSHAIYEAKTGGPNEEPYLTRFVPGYLDTLAAWIGRVKARR